MIQLILLATISTTSHAGFWSRFCEKYLTETNRHEWQHIEEDWLIRSYRSHGLSAAWGNRNYMDEFRSMGEELRRRPQSPQIVQVLLMFERYEGRGLK